ncbi:MAG TPA: M48 family metallopeptidase [Bacteroidota bacterium]|nr:M48 family metallopeptidase [Bacteroidota bacterium]
MNITPGIMRRCVAALFLVASLTAGLSCSTVPLTGRKQLNLVPESEMLSTSFQQYGDFVKQNKISADRSGAELVRRVGTRIRGAVEQYMAANNLSDRLKGYAWEFNLVESNEVNAWCMPGGKVVVYTAILPLTRDEQGLAVVLGHEIAHAIAEHGNERMSQEMIAQFGGAALSELLKSKPAQTQQLWMGVFGAGAQYGVLLPYSRTHESEADHLGLIFMAMAGYDPDGAVDFWQRMSAANKGKAPPEFMSTHPADETRIAQIRQALPEAVQYYHPSR